MITTIKTTHEEGTSEGSRTIGVLLNFTSDFEWYQTLFYLYRDDMYIFFETITDLIDYQLYGEDSMKRAYIEEEEFDSYYNIEADGRLINVEIDGKFSDKLKWN
jgi:hypothetical protein